jgi:hypothetical protein
MSFLKRLICNTGYVCLALVLAISNANAFAKKETGFQFPEEAFDAYNTFYLCSDSEIGIERFKTYLEIILPHKEFIFYISPQKSPNQHFTTIFLFKNGTKNNDIIDVCPFVTKKDLYFFQEHLAKEINNRIMRNPFSPNISISANNVSIFSYSLQAKENSCENEKIKKSYYIYSKYTDWDFLSLISCSYIRKKYTQESAPAYNLYSSKKIKAYFDFIKHELRKRNLGTFFGGG